MNGTPRHQPVRPVVNFALVVALLLTTLALTFTSQVNAAQAVRCVARPSRVEPPPFPAGPSLITESQRRPLDLKPLNFKPVCPEGQVPLVKPLTPALPKGDPLIGPIHAPAPTLRDSQAVAKLIRENLRPFEEVYWKGRGRGKYQPLPPDPSGTCDGLASFDACFYYGSAAFQRTADGGGMIATIERPAYDGSGGFGHTLNEIAVMGGVANGNIVEVGWNISSDQYGDTAPHLFVFHWLDWEPTCYDGCGWQQYSETYFPGMSLEDAVGRDVYLGYVNWGGNWWAWFDNQWLGYFPGSEWDGAYTRNETIQWFGEVATHNGVPPITDMGNGRFPSDQAAARMSALCDVDASDWVCWYRDQQVLGATVPGYYDIDRTAFGQVRYGGPGE